MATIPEPFVRQSYNGLKTAESDLLRNYLMDTGSELDSLRTDVRVGPGEQLPEFQPESFRTSWQETSKFKIDAVVERPETIELVELKDHIRTSALGQLLSYRYWFSLERQPQKPVSLVATAPDLNPGAVQPYNFHNVEIHIQSQEGLERLEKGLDASPPF